MLSSASASLMPAGPIASSPLPRSASASESAVVTGSSSSLQVEEPQGVGATSSSPRSSPRPSSASAHGIPVHSSARDYRTQSWHGASTAPISAPSPLPPSNPSLAPHAHAHHAPHHPFKHFPNKFNTPHPPLSSTASSDSFLDSSIPTSFMASLPTSFALPSSSAPAHRAWNFAWKSYHAQVGQNTAAKLLGSSLPPQPYHDPTTHYHASIAPPPSSYASSTLTSSPINNEEEEVHITHLHFNHHAAAPPSPWHTASPTPSPFPKQFNLAFSHLHTLHTSHTSPRAPGRPSSSSAASSPEPQPQPLSLSRPLTPRSPRSNSSSPSHSRSGSPTRSRPLSPSYTSRTAGAPPSNIPRQHTSSLVAQLWHPATISAADTTREDEQNLTHRTRWNIAASELTADDSVMKEAMIAHHIKQRQSWQQYRDYGEQTTLSGSFAQQRPATAGAVRSKPKSRPLTARERNIMPSPRVLQQHGADDTTLINFNININNQQQITSTLQQQQQQQQPPPQQSDIEQQQSQPPSSTCDPVPDESQPFSSASASVEAPPITSSSSSTATTTTTTTSTTRPFSARPPTSPLTVRGYARPHTASSVRASSGGSSISSSSGAPSSRAASRSADTSRPTTALSSRSASNSRPQTACSVRPLADVGPNKTSVRQQREMMQTHRINQSEFNREKIKALNLQQMLKEHPELPSYNDIVGSKYSARFRAKLVEGKITPSSIEPELEGADTEQSAQAAAESQPEPSSQATDSHTAPSQPSTTTTQSTSTTSRTRPSSAAPSSGSQSYRSAGTAACPSFSSSKGTQNNRAMSARKKQDYAWMKRFEQSDMVPIEEEIKRQRLLAAETDGLIIMPARTSRSHTQSATANKKRYFSKSDVRRIEKQVRLQKEYEEELKRQEAADEAARLAAEQEQQSASSDANATAEVPTQPSVTPPSITVPTETTHEYPPPPLLIPPSSLSSPANSLSRSERIALLSSPRHITLRSRITTPVPWLRLANSRYGAVDSGSIHHVDQSERQHDIVVVEEPNAYKYTNNKRIIHNTFPTKTQRIKSGASSYHGRNPSLYEEKKEAVVLSPFLSSVRPVPIHLYNTLHSSSDIITQLPYHPDESIVFKNMWTPSSLITANNM